jgi:DNA modification methylase
MSDLTLHKGDNFDFISNATVDLVLTDPPFNISKPTNFASYEKNTIHSYQFDDDSSEDWDTYSHEEFIVKLDEWAAGWSRVLRNGGSFAIFCADAYVSHLMDALKRNKLNPRRLITWRKNNAVPVNRQYMPMSANEYIVVGVKPGKDVTFNADVPIVNQNLDARIIESTIVADKVSAIVYAKTREALLGSGISKSQTTFLELDSKSHLEEISNLVSNVLSSIQNDAVKKVLSMYKTTGDGLQYLQACVPNYVQNPLKVGNRIHPTEKPVALLQYLVSLYSNEGDLVLDGFGGSGSSGEAALSLARRAIIVERDAVFFGKLKSRLESQAETVNVI